MNQKLLPVWIATVALALAACTPQASSKTRDAEEEYNIVSARGSLGDRCQMARQVQDAHLKAHDAAGYSRWKVTADADCVEADLNGVGMPANFEERAKIEDQAANASSAAANIPMDPSPSKEQHNSGH